MGTLKERYEELINDRNYTTAFEVLKEAYLSEDESMSTFIHYSKLAEKLDLEALGFRRLRIAILRSFTLEQILPILKVKFLFEKIALEYYLCPYNSYMQDVIDEGSPLYEFKPDIVIVFLRVEDMCPGFGEICSGGKNIELVKNAGHIEASFSSILSNLRHRCHARILVNNFVLPDYPNDGIFDYQNSDGEIQTISRMNSDIIKLTQKYEDTYVFNYNALVSRYGIRNWFDARMWYIAKNPINLEYLAVIAAEYIKYIKSMIGPTKKCLVLDLDNTLWGGVIGEDGLAGIKIGKFYPGNVFQDFQKEILNLYNRGIILAINSKNNSDDVLEVLEKHPEMVLRKKHFAVIKANWNDKAANIKEIALELNIGLDSIVFFDDNPLEIEVVRQEIPEVAAICLPEDILKFKDVILESDFFNKIGITTEDRLKGKQYQAQVERNNLVAKSNSLEDFYRNLGMKTVIKPAGDFEIPRIAQLTQKTNQFNLTTRRYSESDIRNFIEDQNYMVISVDLRDRFGDNGIIGAIILRIEAEYLYIETFLLSCRVMGRTLENSMLSYICNIADEKNLIVKGEYIETNKNQPVKNFYKNMGFELSDASGSSQIWIYNPSAGSIKASEFISME